MRSNFCPTSDFCVSEFLVHVLCCLRLLNLSRDESESHYICFRLCGWFCSFSYSHSCWESGKPGHLSLSPASLLSKQKKNKYIFDHVCIIDLYVLKKK